MIFFTIMAAFDADHYGVRNYSRLPDHGHYLSPDEILDSGLGRVFCIAPTLLGSVRQFRIKEAVRGSCFPAVYDEAVLYRMQYIVWDGTLHPGYCQYSWNENSFFDYLACGSCHAQSARSSFGYASVAPTTTEKATSQVVQHNSRTGVTSSAKTALDSGNGSTPWAAALSAARPSIPCVPRLAKAATFNSSAPSPDPTTPFTVPVLTCLFSSQSHLTPVWIDIHEGEEFEVIIHPALSEGTVLPGMLYSMRPKQFVMLSNAEIAELLMLETRSACFYFIRGTAQTVLDLAKTSFGWLLEFFGQKCASHGRHIVTKPKMSEVIEISDVNEKVVVCEDRRPIKRSGH